MINFVTLLLYISPVIILLVFYVRRKYSYWSERGVGGPRPIFPFGYLLSRLTDDPISFEIDHMKKYGKVYGVYTGLKPTLTLCDVELIKNVLIKDFHLWINRREFNVLDPHWNENLFMTNAEDWKRIRTIVSPAFTSGKLRRMYPLLKEASDKLTNYIDKVCATQDEKIDIKKIISGFTIDVIASTSFGTDTDSNGDRSTFNPFLHHGQRIFKEISNLKFLLILTCPKWFLRLINLYHPFPKDSFSFFVQVCREMIHRGGKREDLMKLLKEANVSSDVLKNIDFSKLTANNDVEKLESNNKTVTDETQDAKFLTETEIIAQSILFFIAGFETTASAMTNTIFELAHNPEVQERCFKDLNEKLADKGPENLDEYYETIINDVPYLEAMLKESLRKYPPVSRLERRLGAQSYNLNGLELEKDTLVEISTISVHYDEDNYPNPHQYNPDRFMPENKHLLVPYTYIPFGAGPRNCIGMRFAYQEAKIGLSSLIRKFQFVKTDKTPAKLEFPTNNVGMFANSFEISISRR